jgi:hypothetical protein
MLPGCIRFRHADEIGANGLSGCEVIIVVLTRCTIGQALRVLKEDSDGIWILV